MKKNILTDHAFFFIFLLGSLSIISSSYVGLNGAHIWRQSDAYAQILAFSHFKGMAPLSDFFGRTALYDIPIYQYLTAKLAVIFSTDPLVTSKYFNLLFWFTLLVSGGLIADKLHKHSAFFFWIVASTSPILLHYYATPLPDIMALSLSSLAIAILLYKIDHECQYTLAAICLLVISALIKSPIPFVFLVFYATYLVLSPGQPKSTQRLFRVGLVFMLSLAAAVLAESLRKRILGVDVDGFAQDPAWYFGTIEQRLSKPFWQAILTRTGGTASFSYLAYALLIAIVWHAVIAKKRALNTLAPCILAFFSGWLVFANVYYIHDYYELPVSIMLFIAGSISIAVLLDSIDQRQWLTAVGLRSCSAYELACYASLLLAPLVMLHGYKMSQYKAESIQASARFALRHQNSFIWIGPAGNDDRNPSIGGLLKTPFTPLSAQELEAQCDELLRRHAAVVVTGQSACLRRHKSSATTYIEDDGLQIYVDEHLHADNVPMVNPQP